MDCPICKQHIRADANIAAIGNSDIHADCLNKLRKEAEGKGATIHFLWRGERCTEARLVFEEKR